MQCDVSGAERLMYKAPEQQSKLLPIYSSSEYSACLFR